MIARLAAVVPIFTVRIKLGREAGVETMVIASQIHVSGVGLGQHVVKKRLRVQKHGG